MKLVKCYELRSTQGEEITDEVKWRLAEQLWQILSLDDILDLIYDAIN